eukprot:gene7438-11761_t
MNVVGDETEVVENFFQKLEEYFQIIKQQIKIIENAEKNEKLNETRKSEKNVIVCEKILSKKIPKFIESIEIKEEKRTEFKKQLKNSEEYFHLLKHQLVIVSEFDEEVDKLTKLTNDLKLLKLETESKLEKIKDSTQPEDVDFKEICLESLKMIQESLEKYQKLN